MVSEGMFAQLHQPDKLQPALLDMYLARGWFRMGQAVFTTNFLNFKNQLYSAIWLRVKLADFNFDSTQQKLCHRNSRYRVEFGNGSIAPDAEALYKRYRERLPFEAASSLRDLLYRNQSKSIFDTRQVSVYDGSAMIAAGYFDVGDRSAAGITSFYDPAYRKFSLGRYLIYQKMHYCKTLGLDFFYPGYFVPGYKFFDYKLTMGRPALEFLALRTQEWIPIGNFTNDHIPVAVMGERLARLRTQLSYAGTKAAVVSYSYFDANLIPELLGHALFDFPLFLYYEGSEEAPGPIVVYDVRDSRFHIVRCGVLWTSETAALNDTTYSRHLLKTDRLLFSAASEEEIVAKIKAGIEVDID